MVVIHEEKNVSHVMKKITKNRQSIFIIEQEEEAAAEVIRD